jgi:hypothetical protein
MTANRTAPKGAPLSVFIEDREPHREPYRTQKGAGRVAVPQQNWYGV